MNALTHVSWWFSCHLKTQNQCECWATPSSFFFCVLQQLLWAVSHFASSLRDNGTHSYPGDRPLREGHVQKKKMFSTSFLSSFSPFQPFFLKTGGKLSLEMIPEPVTALCALLLVHTVLCKSKCEEMLQSTDDFKNYLIKSFYLKIIQCTVKSNKQKKSICGVTTLFLFCLNRYNWCCFIRKRVARFYWVSCTICYNSSGDFCTLAYLFFLSLFLFCMQSRVLH